MFIGHLNYLSVMCLFKSFARFSIIMSLVLSDFVGAFYVFLDVSLFSVMHVVTILFHSMAFFL